MIISYSPEVLSSSDSNNTYCVLLLLFIILLMINLNQFRSMTFSNVLNIIVSSSTFIFT